MTLEEFEHLLSVYRINRKQLSAAIPCDRKTLYNWINNGITPEQQQAIYRGIENYKISEVQKANNDIEALKLMKVR